MRVKIKTWEELEKKYGLDKFGDIENNRSNWIFSVDMKYLCGNEIELNEVYKNSKDEIGMYHKDMKYLCGNEIELATLS